MKGPAVFLVLSLVVMMAEPAEGIIGLITGLASGIGHAIRGISNLVKKRRHGVDEVVEEQQDQDQNQQQLHKLLFQQKFAQHRFT
uniref:Uncharacterized protein n=1 Tax=Fundulus heteroclitus TaxID=8078 RepID=A0A3Q2PHR5_FUNHE